MPPSPCHCVAVSGPLPFLLAHAAVEEPSRVQKLITPLIDSWELEDEEEWPGAERVCGPHTALARIWLTAVVGRLEASGCSSKAQGEASKW